MKLDDLRRAADPKRLSTYLVELPAAMHNVGADGRVETVRETEHKGHHIVVRTTYQVEVDGRVLHVPLGVDNDGHVHCHSLPNYQFTSALGLVKQLIDSFPADFAPGSGTGSTAAGGHEGMHMSTRRPSRKGK
jgi:hypothetical protein